MKKWIAILSLVSISSTAFADVCGIVTQPQAEATLSFLTKGAKLTQTFASSPRLTVKTVTIEKSALMDNIQYYEIKVNGQSIDPGHTNIVINSNVSLNLGRLVGCDAQVSDPDLIAPTQLPASVTSK